MDLLLRDHHPLVLLQLVDVSLPLGVCNGFFFPACSSVLDAAEGDEEDEDGCHGNGSDDDTDLDTL